MLVDLSAAAPAGGSAVSLTSSNPAALALPASATVAAGATSGSFAYTTGAVNAATPVTVTAVLGASSVSTTLTVTPLALLSVLVFPNEVAGGDPATIRLQLTGPASRPAARS